MGEQKPEKTKKHICAGLLAHVFAGMPCAARHSPDRAYRTRSRPDSG